MLLALTLGRRSGAPTRRTIVAGGGSRLPVGWVAPANLAGSDCTHTGTSRQGASDGLLASL